MVGLAAGLMPTTMPLVKAAEMGGGSARKGGKRARDPSAAEPLGAEDASSSGCENGADGNLGERRRSGRERSTVERYEPTSVVNSKKVRTRAPPRFHITPTNEWEWLLKKMKISASNTMEWRSGTPLPVAPAGASCWLLPCKCDTAIEIGQYADELVTNGWKLLTCAADVVARIGNKYNLFRHAEALGMLEYLPQHYETPASASYPCMLKAHAGEHGKGIYIVHSADEIAAKSGSPMFDKTKWLLQELCAGRIEKATSLLVKDGTIHDAICTDYEYDCDESGVYVWPNVQELQERRRSHEDIPPSHLDTMQKLCTGFTGICNFNYKVRPDGTMCIFEVNARIGADLACDVPRKRAATFFAKLDVIGASHMPSKA